MSRIIFPHTKKNCDDANKVVRVSFVVPKSLIPEIDSTWKQTQFNNRSEFVRAAILQALDEHETKLGKMNTLKVKKNVK